MDLRAKSVVYISFSSDHDEGHISMVEQMLGMEKVPGSTSSSYVKFPPAMSPNQLSQLCMQTIKGSIPGTSS